MTYNTASFDSGSEFRVDWIIYTIKRNSKYGETMSHRYSEIFDTYEKALIFREQLQERGAMVKVRRPGNKAFTMAHNAKKA